jgi:hypothetical protein
MPEEWNPYDADNLRRTSDAAEAIHESLKVLDPALPHFEHLDHLPRIADELKRVADGLDTIAKAIKMSAVYIRRPGSSRTRKKK